MILITDLDLVEDLTGKELKLLCVLVKKVVVFNDAPPTNQQLADMCGWGLSTFKKVRKSLEDKELILRRPGSENRVDYKLRATGISGTVTAAEGQRRRENPPEPPKAAPPPPPEPEPMIVESLEPLEVVEEVDKGESYKTVLETDDEFFNQTAKSTGLKKHEVRALLKVFMAEKKLLYQNSWQNFNDFRKHFFFWVKKQKPPKLKPQKNFTSDNRNYDVSVVSKQ